MKQFITEKPLAVENIRLAAKLRLQFEDALQESTGQSDFERAFEGQLENYATRIVHAFENTFGLDEAKRWFDSEQIDIVTWHYRTRHAMFVASALGEWFSGQIIFNGHLREAASSETQENLSPYPDIRSPYIGIFSNERTRERDGIGGPISIMLRAGTGARDETNRLADWWNSALQVPPEVTEFLIRLPEHSGKQDPLGEAELKQIIRRNRAFMRQLTVWMRRVCGENISGLKALNNLLASLKVTFNLLRSPAFKCDLPRSTFLAPAYVAGEEVGGMAFACNGIVSREAAFIGESISSVLLSYLRLREDAIAHQAIEEQQKLDEAKRFFIDRLAHDFRHPIDSLKTTVIDLSRAFNVIQQQIEQINHMMDDTILAIEGRDPKTLLRPKKRQDSVNEFLMDIRSYFRKQFEERGKQLILLPVDRELNFQIDKGMVHEILENLIRNSLEHGGPRTRIFVEQVGDKFFFHVQDDGSGILAEQRANIFRPFLRPKLAENASRGRGLAIAKMLAEAHGGTLRLDPATDEWKTDFVLEISAQ